MCINCLIQSVVMQDFSESFIPGRRRVLVCLFSNDTLTKPDLVDMTPPSLALVLSAYNEPLNQKMHSHRPPSWVWFRSTHRWNSRGVNWKTGKSTGCVLKQTS